MKYAVAVSALAATVLAQDISTGIPKCANSCITAVTTGDKIAGCNQGDIKCVCENDSFLDEIACCLADACDEDGKNKAVSFARGICNGAGVEVPDEVVCSNPSGASKTGDNQPEETGESGDDSDDDDSAASRAVPVAGGLAGGVLAAMALL